MTPDEAAGFYEDDEDPQHMFARFDAGPHGITWPPAGHDYAWQVRWGRDYIRDRYAGRDEAPGWYARGGVIPHDPRPHGDSVPLLLSRLCPPLTDGELAELRDRLEKALAKGRVRLPLSRRTRLRLAISRVRDNAGIWLSGHGHYGVALWLWRDRRGRRG